MDKFIHSVKLDKDACTGCINCIKYCPTQAIRVHGGKASIKPQFWLNFLIAMLVAVAVPFVLTILVGSRKLSAADRGLSTAAAEPAAPSVAPDAEEQPQAEPPAAGAEGVTAPLSGRVIPMEEIPDQVFSQGILGEGVGIEPTGNVVVAPADATVCSVIEDSRHAVGLTLDNGAELLIHVGIDTVSMNGDGFQLHVKEGDRVHLGDKLITFDPEKIKAAGHPTTTAFLVTDPGDLAPTFETNVDAQAGRTVVIRF